MPASSAPQHAASVWLERLLGPVLALGLVAETLVEPAADQPWAATAAAVGGLALLVRRRHALVAFVAGMLGLRSLELVTPPEFLDESPVYVLAFVIATYSLGRWSSGWEHWVAPVAVVASTLGFAASDAARSEAPWTITPGSVIFAVVFCAGPWAVGRVIAALDARNRRLRAEHAEVAERAAIEERARIARELHDVVSHAISVTVLQARGARRCLDEDPGAAREALDAIEHTNAQALGDMRRLLAVLRDTEADTTTAPQPSLARLDDLLTEVRDAGTDVDATVTGARRELPPGVDLSAYRIVQEALTNVLRHAPGASASVALDYADDALRVTVTNSAPARPSSWTGSGNGLVGIRERVAVVGGDVSVEAVADGGYRLNARLPYSVEVP